MGHWEHTDECDENETDKPHDDSVGGHLSHERHKKTIGAVQVLAHLRKKMECNMVEEELCMSAQRGAECTNMWRSCYLHPRSKFALSASPSRGLYRKKTLSGA